MFHFSAGACHKYLCMQYSLSCFLFLFLSVTSVCETRGSLELPLSGIVSISGSHPFFWLLNLLLVVCG